MSIDPKPDLITDSVRRSGRQLDFLPLQNHSAPSNGAGVFLHWRSINISPSGVKSVRHDLASNNLLPLDAYLSRCYFTDRSVTSVVTLC